MVCTALVLRSFYSILSERQKLIEGFWFLLHVNNDIFSKRVTKRIVLIICNLRRIFVTLSSRKMIAFLLALFLIFLCFHDMHISTSMHMEKRWIEIDESHRIIPTTCHRKRSDLLKLIAKYKCTIVWSSFLKYK